MAEPKLIYEFGPFLLDPEEHQLLKDNRAVPLKPKVFELLLALVQNSGHLLTKGELMDIVWRNSLVEEHNLTVAISELRRSLGGGRRSTYIQTITKRGYRFVAAVRRREQNPALRAGHGSNSSGKRVAQSRTSQDRSPTGRSAFIFFVAAGRFGSVVISVIEPDG